MTGIRFDPSWESAERWLRELPGRPDEEWAYLTIIDRTDRTNEVQVGIWHRNTVQDGFMDAAEELVQWARDVAGGNSIGVARTVLRVRSWKLKGGTAPPGSRQFVVFDDNAPEAMGLGSGGMLMDPAQVEAHATANGLRSLGEHYRTFVDLLLKGVGGLITIHTTQGQALAADLAASRTQNVALFKAQLADRRETSETEALIEVHRADSKVKEAAIARGLTMLETVGKALSMELASAAGTSNGAKTNGASSPAAGLDAQTMRLLQVIGSSDELAAALRDPRTLELLRQPEAQRGIAEILMELVSTVESAEADLQQQKADEAGPQPESAPDAAPPQEAPAAPPES